MRFRQTISRRQHYSLLTIIPTTYKMERQTFIDTLFQSMRDSARQVRLLLGRPSSRATREQALRQVAMLQAAKEAAQATVK